MQFHPRSDFPDGFLFGTATSAYQIEGHAFGGAGRTHWDSFAATPGNVVRAENGARACDHYHRWEEDLDLIAALGLRCLPVLDQLGAGAARGARRAEPRGARFLRPARRRDAGARLKPCGHALSLGTALAAGRSRRLAQPRHRGLVRRFHRDVMGRIGDRVWSAAPINEPWCVAWLSHFLGHHAPGLRDIRATARAMHHVLLAHGRAIEVMRGLGMAISARCSISNTPTPADDSPEAAAAARL
jgi:beta-glucosidase